MVLEEEQLFLAQEKPEKLGKAGVGTDETTNVQLILKPLDRLLLEAFLLTLLAEQADVASQALPECLLRVSHFLGFDGEALNITCV